MNTMCNEIDYCDKIIFSIEQRDNKKYIHILGYGYHVGEPEDYPYRWLEYTGLIFPLNELTININKIEKIYGHKVKQYIEDVDTYNSLKSIINNDYKAVAVKESDISTDMECGMYMLVSQ